MAPPICTWNESNYPTARLSPAFLRSPLGKTVILERSEESPHSSPCRPVHPFLTVLPESVTPKSCGLLFLPAIVVRTRGVARKGPRQMFHRENTVRAFIWGLIFGALAVPALGYWYFTAGHAPVNIGSRHAFRKNVGPQGAERPGSKGNAKVCADPRRRGKPACRSRRLPRPLCRLPRPAGAAQVRDRNWDVPQPSETPRRQRPNRRRARRELLESGQWDSPNRHAWIPRFSFRHANVAGKPPGGTSGQTPQDRPGRARRDPGACPSSGTRRSQEKIGRIKSRYGQLTAQKE